MSTNPLIHHHHHQQQEEFVCRLAEFLSDPDGERHAACDPEQSRRAPLASLARDWRKLRHCAGIHGLSNYAESRYLLRQLLMHDAEDFAADEAPKKVQNS